MRIVRDDYEDQLERARHAEESIEKFSPSYHRLYQMCFGDTENLRVSGIWESREAFEKSGKTLYPIMQEIGAAPPEIEFFEVHNIIVGKQASILRP